MIALTPRSVPATVWIRAPGLSVLALGIAAAAFAFCVAGPDELHAPRAWFLTVGFAAIAALVAPARSRTWSPCGLAVFFAVYGGVSAVIAGGTDQRASDPGREPARALEKLGIAMDRTPDAPQALAGAFDEAALLTIAAGLAVIGTASLVDRYAGRGTEIRREPP